MNRSTAARVSRAHRFLASWPPILVLVLRPASAAAQATITVDPATRFQTINGWKCVTFAAQDEPAFPAFQDPLFDRVINEAGINRVRLEVRSGAENSTDYFTAAISNGNTLNLTVRSLKPRFTGSIERNSDLSQADGWREVGASAGGEFLFNWSEPVGTAPAFYRFGQP